MIVWLNGTFGVGKTTTSAHLVDMLHGFRQFDPEWVGFMVANNLTDHPVTNFWEYPSWRRLVPMVADEIMHATGQHLVAAQSVLIEDYWSEITRRLHALHYEVFHVLLDADSDRIHARIDADEMEPEHVRPWRHRHVGVYEGAREWLVDSADMVVDTAVLDATATAREIESAITARL